MIYVRIKLIPITRWFGPSPLRPADRDADGNFGDTFGAAVSGWGIGSCVRGGAAPRNKGEGEQVGRVSQPSCRISRRSSPVKPTGVPIRRGDGGGGAQNQQHRRCGHEDFDFSNPHCRLEDQTEVSSSSNSVGQRHGRRMEGAMVVVGLGTSKEGGKAEPVAAQQRCLWSTRLEG
jgi:hypothetical protein